MNERGVWLLLKTGMGKRWDASRHEDKIGIGVPDVSFGCEDINGWIELKYIMEWPVRPTTSVNIPLSPLQKHWLTLRGLHGGNCWLFVRIRDDFLLFSYHRLGLINGKTKAKLLRICDKSWHGRVDWEEFRSVIVGGGTRIE